MSYGPGVAYPHLREVHLVADALDNTRIVNRVLHLAGQQQQQQQQQQKDEG
jgi:hypothetical protein